MYNEKVNISGLYSSLEEAFKFFWSSFADEQNTLPKSTKRNVKLNKSAFGTPWLPDLLCKHWFTSTAWNFCRWVADVSPRDTSQAARSEEKWLFSQVSAIAVLNRACARAVCLGKGVSFILIKLIAKRRESLFPGTIFHHINGAYKVSATLASPPTYSLWSSRVRGHAGGPINPLPYQRKNCMLLTFP